MKVKVNQFFPPWWCGGTVQSFQLATRLTLPNRRKSQHITPNTALVLTAGINTEKHNDTTDE